MTDLHTQTAEQLAEKVSEGMSGGVANDGQPYCALAELAKRAEHLDLDFRGAEKERDRERVRAEATEKERDEALAEAKQQWHWRQDHKEAREAAEARVKELEAALECFHDEEDIEYVDRGGKTWKRCKACGLLELWEGGMRCAVDVDALAGDTETPT